MEVANEASVIAWLAANGRTLVRPGGFSSPDAPGEAYRLSFDVHGTPASDVAELALNEFLPTRVDSGLFRVIRISHAASAELAVFDQLVRPAGPAGKVAGGPAHRLVVENEYGLLLAAMSWAMVCGWQFEFVATGGSYGMSSREEGDLRLEWAAGTPLHGRVTELIANLELQREPDDH